jgi:hypothetical protein
MVIFAALPIPIVILGFILHKTAPNTRLPRPHAVPSENTSTSAVPFAYDPYKPQSQGGFQPGHSPNPSYTPAYTPALEAGQHGYPSPPQMTMNVEPPRVPGEPATGFGYLPATSSGIMHNAAFVLVPTLLLTIQAIIKLAQATYSPTLGESTPWVSLYLIITAFIF